VKALCGVLAVITLAVIACDDNGDDAGSELADDATTTTTTTTTTAPEPEREPGDPIDSGIEGVPIPENAEQDPDHHGLWYVPVSDDAQLLAWYMEHLPPFTGHNGWEWCRLFEPDDFTDGTTWAYVGGASEDEFGPFHEYLEVTVYAEAEEVASAGAVTIGRVSGSDQC
jgi:hypothetical protein